MRKITVKKKQMGSQEDIDSDAGFVDGTPEHRWNEFWELVTAVSWVTQGKFDFDKPLNRNVARKVYAQY
ncbi:MAG: hypothetical protein LBC85_08145 [Fibromonadaceae bacterium]|jgi:hypothetical protein|nr:hypothetical protein [Fibromonadaceae bacterium]